MNHSASILVVNDERLIRWSISQRLAESGHRVIEAADACSARELVADADLVILDDKLPDATSLGLIAEFRERGIKAPILLLTGHATAHRALEAMRLGAWHYVAKPLDLEELVLLVERALETTLLRSHVEAMRSREVDGSGFDKIVGISPTMLKTKKLMRKIAVSPASTILLTGESGTGKDLAAKAIHYASGRAKAPLMNISCSALQDTLLEAELFGHEGGAFTDAKRLKRGLLEVANGGTVFLDEVGETSPAIQAKLLRFLEDRSFRRVGGERDIQVDVCIIAASHRDLAAAVEEGDFRDDLYWRLRVLPIELPPLRERTGDIQLLAKTFLRDFGARFGRHELAIEDRAMRAMLSYRWPGNVRELKNTVERAVLLSDADVLTADDLLLPGARAADQRGHLPLPADGIDLDAVECGFVEQALERTGGNRTHAAKLLGLNRDQVRYRVDKFDL